MHQTRKEASIKLPIKRKGTKYVARALGNLDNSVPVVIAIRDMLKLAKTAKEVDEMIKLSKLKINGRTVYDRRESINLFGILEADKPYRLSLLPTKRFTFETANVKDGRLCKIVSRTLISGNKIQVNLHDGSNIIGTKDMAVGDSLYLDFSSKVLKHIKLSSAKEVFILSGKYIGTSAKINSVKDKSVTLSFKGNDTPVVLHQRQVIVQ